jgi:hypothetical protein
MRSSMDSALLASASRAGTTSASRPVRIRKRAQPRSSPASWPRGAQVRRALGEFESLPVRVNGQPARLLRGRHEERYGEAERLAADQGLALLQSDDVDAKQLAALALANRDA